MALRLTYTKGSSPNTARLNSGEAFLMFYKVKDVDLTGRAFVFSVYDSGTYEKSYDADIINGIAYWVISGAHSTAFYKLGTALNYDFTERLRDETRETIFTGILTVDRTAAVIKSLATAPLGRVIVGINHSFDPTSSGAPDIAITYEPYVPPVAAPVFTTIPDTLGGTAVGSVRVAVDGYVDNGTITGRQWLRNGVEITGATGSIYQLTEADLGALVSVRVRATGPGGTITATSASFTVVAAPIVVTPAPTFTASPSISGTATVGQTLTGADGTVTNGSVTARQWLRNNVEIAGATGSTYALVSADTGALVSFRVTARGPGGSTVSTSSAVTVAAVPVAVTIENTNSNSSLLPTQVEGAHELFTAREARIKALEIAYAS